MRSPGTDRVAELVLLLFPQGGQRAARRNAQVALADAQARAEDRREANSVLRALDQRTPAPMPAPMPVQEIRHG
jgi:hypothetical protein